MHHQLRHLHGSRERWRVYRAGEADPRVREPGDLRHILLEEQLEQGEVHGSSTERRLVDAFAERGADAAWHWLDEARRTQREVPSPTEVDLGVRLENPLFEPDQVRRVDRSDAKEARVRQRSLCHDGRIPVEVTKELEMEVDSSLEVECLFRIEDLQHG